MVDEHADPAPSDSQFGGKRKSSLNRLGQQASTVQLCLEEYDYESNQNDNNFSLTKKKNSTKTLPRVRTMN